MDRSHITIAARNALLDIHSKHSVTVLPAYNRAGALILPDAYDDTLCGATARVQFVAKKFIGPITDKLILNIVAVSLAVRFSVHKLNVHSG